MKWPVLALFERSLRVESRSLLMCLARVALPAMILLALLPMATAARYGRFGAPGLQFFQSIVWLDFVFITLAGLSYFASAVTEEKEEMTLGLLRMTGLSPLAVLFGKSTSRLMGAMLLLLVQVPFTLLAVTLGGISNHQIFAAYAALLAYTFVLCNLALVWSVVLPQTTWAAVATGVCLFAFLTGPPAVIEMMGASTRAGAAAAAGFGGTAAGLCQMLIAVSPITALTHIFTTGMRAPLLSPQVLASLACGAGWFLAAWAGFEGATREQKEQAPSRWFVLQRGGRQRRVPAHLSGARVITWKDFQFMAGGTLGFWAKLLLLTPLYGVIACAPLFAREPLTRAFAGGSLMIASLALLAIMLSFDASRIFREELRWKTLAGLMSLPVSVPELAYRKVAGALLGMLPLAVFFTLGVAIHPAGFAKAVLSTFADANALGGVTTGVIQFLFFLHLVAYLSLVVKRGALPLAMGLYYIGGMFLMAPLGLFLGMNRSAAPMMAVLTLGTFLLTAVVHVQIGRRLRRAAAEE